jgi:hypothetical protein
LGNSEKFLFAMMDIPCVEARICSAKLVRTYGPRLEGVEKMCETLCTACSEINASDALHLVLKVGSRGMILYAS